jgi:NADH:ubiquinone oxidoreductase subunit D
MEFVERLCGARLHASYIVPGGVNSDISLELIDDINKFALLFDKRIDEIRELLHNNRV